MPADKRPSPRPRGTLASLAADLGVSRTTVSNAYNHPEQLSAATRERILAAAAARGYPGPDPTARSLRTRRVGAVGVLLTERLSYAFEDLASVEFLAGLAESSYATKNSLTLVPEGPDLTSTVVDGFVVYSIAADDPHLSAARSTGLPLVVCDQPYGVADLPFVGIDDRAAVAPAAQALVDAGHRRVGIIAKRLTRQRHDGVVDRATVESADLHVQRSRILGALDVFAAAGIVDVPVVVRHHNDHVSAVDAARELLTGHPDLTAVLCTTDSMAFGVLEFARSRGLAVPEQLSVTGFDGVELAYARGLTTVDQPMRAKGAAAGRMLDELIRHPEDGPRRLLLPTTFVPGATVAAPATS
ncbi:LacI family DNA-binding transcriptional regulator [Corynebacterium uterequi]|uniref:Transcriptional regulator, LacI family n=1 Tax=Corynebacterium uterequi TaxID=1072256 RepID=A0A0G3HL49_9CORY|nr:LacI family DNA-binding transcriptional regulator [Corynebacterium uterequi]AKK11837.1 transcriptional regulator, LacI family [Corynebacterium uterequi]